MRGGIHLLNPEKSSVVQYNIQEPISRKEKENTASIPSFFKNEVEDPSISMKVYDLLKL